MDISSLPKFKYHPNFYKTQMAVFGEGECACCHKKTNAYIESMYAVEDVDCICLNCVADGSAADKFDGSFIQDADKVDNPEAVDELFHRTPGYFSWQGENWKACCNDYCAYMSDADEAGFNSPSFQQQLFDGNIICETDMTPQELIKNGSYIRGYLFQCLHCRKKYLRIDMD